MREIDDMIEEFTPEDYKELMRVASEELGRTVEAAMKKKLPRKPDGSLDELSIMATMAVLYGMTITQFAASQDAVCDLMTLFSRFAHEVAHAMWEPEAPKTPSDPATQDKQQIETLTTEPKPPGGRYH